MGVIMHNNIPYGGGSSIEPNPAGTASTDLTKLGIDGVNYNVKDADAAREVQATITEAQSRVNLADGDSVPTILGKIKKWFSDLKDLAFIGKDGTSSTKYLRGDGTWQNFPTIPTVNDGTLTIQKNGTNVQTFSANQSGNATANIECATPSDVEGSKVATGNPLTITDAAGIKAEKIEITFEPKQAGSGTPSPSNIRPITGYTSLSADRCGKNLLNIGNAVSDWFATASDGVKIDLNTDITTRVTATVTPSTGTITVTYYNNNGYKWMSKVVNLAKNTQYIYSASQSAGFKILGFDSLADGSVGTVINSTRDVVFNTGNYNYYVLSFYPSNANISSMMIRQKDETNTFEAYNSHNVTIQLDQTLYGGKLTILQDGSADVDVTDGINIYDGSSDESWTYYNASNSCYYTVLNSDAESYTDGSATPNLMSNMLNPIPQSGSFATNGMMARVTNTRNLYCTNTAWGTTTESLRASLASNPLQVIYKLATPFTIHLSPVEALTLLQGLNNVWTDGTTLSLTYQPDNAIGQAKGTAQELVDSASTWKLFAESANANIALPTNCKELYICVIYVTGSTSAIMYDFHILPDILTKATSYFRQGDYYTPDYFSRCEIRIRKTSNVYDTRVECLYMNNTTDRAANTKVKVYYR